jgi:hypothetical protein
MYNWSLLEKKNSFLSIMLGYYALIIYNSYLINTQICRMYRFAKNPKITHETDLRNLLK